MKKQNTSSGLATAIRVIGILNVIGGFVIGFATCGQGGMFATWHDENPFGLIMFIISGVIGWILCFGLAACVQAATVYLRTFKEDNKEADGLSEEEAHDS